MIIVWTLKPAKEYNVIIQFRLCVNFFALPIGVNSAVSNAIPHPIITTNGELLTSITSVVRVTSLFVSMRLWGICT